VLRTPLHALGVGKVGEPRNLLFPNGLITQKSGQKN